MNYIAQLLPAQRAVKSEHSHKDKRQKNHFQSSDDGAGQESYREEAQTLTADAGGTELAVEPVFQERRSGEDRRKKNITRGRWLDSRDKQDRRKPADVYVRI